jgi:hypothetical protein
MTVDRKLGELSEERPARFGVARRALRNQMIRINALIGSRAESVAANLFSERLLSDSS